MCLKLIIYFSLPTNDEEKFNFKQIYFKYKNFVWRQICASSLDINLREDVMQDIFYKLYCSMGKFQSEQALCKWLKIVTKSTLIDASKKESNFKRYMQYSLDEEEIINSCIVSDTLLDDIIQQELSMETAKIIDRLKPIHKEVIILHYFLEFTPKEISKMIRKPLDTVYSRLSKAKEVLYNEINKAIENGTYSMQGGDLHG